jgi:bla regulator protein blaR1
MKNSLALIAVLICSGMAGSAGAQGQLPAFDVATIKPSGPDSAPISIQRLPGGRLVTSNTPLSMLIQWAYELDEGRLLNVPRGLESLRFDVVAKAPEPDPARGQMQLMMRGLLAERFKLTVHQETRELLAYTLITEPSGAKVRAARTDEPADPNPFRMSDAGSLTGARVTADMLATVLSNQLGRPVKNETGFAGVFDFSLRWSPDGATVPADTADRPSLFEAIREQLGFRLVARRTPIDVVVIDHVERMPTEN